MAEKPPLFLAPIAEGMGDLVLALPIIDALKARGDTVSLVVRSPRQVELASIIPGLKEVVREPDFLADRKDRTYINLRDHPLQRHHRWGSPDFASSHPGYTIIEILTDICRDFGIEPDFVNLKPLPVEIRRSLAGTILFIPGSNGAFKSWSAGNWIALAAKLASIKTAVAVIGQPEKSQETRELVDAGLPHYSTRNLKAAIEAISSCRAVVSVDTGLMHLALQQGIPTTAIYPDHLTFLRRHRLCRPVLSPRCDPECFGVKETGCGKVLVDFPDWKDEPLWSCGIEESRRCLSRLSTEKVWQAVKETLEIEREPKNDNTNKESQAASAHRR